MENIVNRVKSHALGVAEYFAPVLKDSKFRETGVITPEEFVAAGDHLVYHCPTWQWAQGDPSNLKSYLPPDKQFLITRSVPCYQRIKQLEYSGDKEKVLEGDDIDSGWVDTHHFDEAIGCSDYQVTEMRLEDNAKGDAKQNLDDDDDGEAMDMEEFEQSGMLDKEDPNAVSQSVPMHVNKNPSTNEEKETNVVATRTYDLNITYDKYYQTPRMWLCGFDEKRKPLTVEQMYEDFSQDHANKTITMEQHPHLVGPPMASIHPCRHAEVMKKLIGTLADSGKQLDVHQYLLVFLKFVQAVIPTIEYDYTRNVQL